MAEVIDYRFVVRRGLATAWATKNDVLFAGEFGLETDTKRMKMGDGTTAWNSLQYLDKALTLSMLGGIDQSTRANGLVLAWDEANKQYTHVAQPGGGGGGGDSGGTKITWPAGADRVTFGGLNLWADGVKTIRGVISCGQNTGAGALWIYFNGDQTAANYYRRRRNGGGAWPDFYFSDGFALSENQSIHFELQIGQAVHTYPVATPNKLLIWNHGSFQDNFMGADVVWKDASNVTSITIASSYPNTKGSLILL